MECSIAQENTAPQTLPADGTESPPAAGLRAACAPPPWGPRFAAAAAGPKPARNGQMDAKTGSGVAFGAIKKAAKSGQKRPRSAAHPHWLPRWRPGPRFVRWPSRPGSPSGLPPAAQKDPAVAGVVATAANCKTVPFCAILLHEAANRGLYRTVDAEKAGVELNVTQAELCRWMRSTCVSRPHRRNQGKMANLRRSHRP